MSRDDEFMARYFAAIDSRPEVRRRRRRFNRMEKVLRRAPWLARDLNCGCSVWLWRRKPFAVRVSCQKHGVRRLLRFEGGGVQK